MELWCSNRNIPILFRFSLPFFSFQYVFKPFVWLQGQLKFRTNTSIPCFFNVYKITQGWILLLYIHTYATAQTNQTGPQKKSNRRSTILTKPNIDKRVQPFTDRSCFQAHRGGGMKRQPPQWLYKRRTMPRRTRKWWGPTASEESSLVVVCFQIRDVVMMGKRMAGVTRQNMRVAVRGRLGLKWGETR